MKLTYISNSRILTEKAHGIQIMKMCEAFVQNGVEVKLIVPKRLNIIKDDPFEYYEVKKNFLITKLPTLDLVSFGRIGFWIQHISFAIFVFSYLLFKKTNIIYSRDDLSLFGLSFIKNNLY